jgi:hypothetical protein
MTTRLSLLSTIVVALAACGGSKSDDPQAKPAAEPSKAEPAPAESKTEPAPPQTPPEPPKVREASPTEVRAETVKLGAFIPKAGDTYTETVKIRFQRVLEASEGAKVEYSELDERHEFEARVEVVEADDKGATKAKIVYVSRTDQDPEGGRASRLPAHPATDKTYVLSREGERTTVTYEDGTAPSAKETRAILDANFAFATGRFTGLLPTGELEPEQQFELDEQKVAPLLEARPRRGQELKRGLLTYRGLADVDGTTVAVFALDVQLETLAGILHTTMTLGGELLFDPKTGRLVRATLQGPTQIESETGVHGGAQAKGVGAVTIDAEVK